MSEMQLVDEMIRYVDGEPFSPDSELSVAEAELGGQRLRLVVLRLLGWMKLQHRLGKRKDLTLTQRYEWCDDSVLLIDERGLFSSAFRVDEGSVQFASHIENDECMELCAEVDSRFKPRLMDSRAVER